MLYAAIGSIFGQLQPQILIFSLPDAGVETAETVFTGSHGILNSPDLSTAAIPGGSVRFSRLDMCHWGQTDHGFWIPSAGKRDLHPDTEPGVAERRCWIAMID
jgi:hypothetical protein